MAGAKLTVGNVEIAVRVQVAGVRREDVNTVLGF